MPAGSALGPLVICFNIVTSFDSTFDSFVRLGPSTGASVPVVLASESFVMQGVGSGKRDTRDHRNGLVAARQ